MNFGILGGGFGIYGWLSALKDNDEIKIHTLTKYKENIFSRDEFYNIRNKIIWDDLEDNILKNSDDGFYIAEQDMKLRGYGDIIGFKQSGIKYFRIADPVHHENLFRIAEKNIKAMSFEELNNPNFDILLKLFDKVDLIDEEAVPS